MIQQIRQQWLGVTIGMLALFVALDGPANAKKLITGKDIKNGSITSADLSKKTVSSLKGKTGAAGKNGTNGTNGTPGPQGPAGPQGPPGTGSADSPQDILSKLQTVDGENSDLDADRLDGFTSTDFPRFDSPVSGVLQGTFANPALRPGVVRLQTMDTSAVNSATIVNESITGADIANTTIPKSKMALGSVSLDKLDDQSIAVGEKLVTFTTPALASGACRYTAWQTLGAEIGDLVIASPTANNEDGIFTEPTVVSSTALAIVKVCNAATGTSDAFTRSYRLTIVSQT